MNTKDIIKLEVDISQARQDFRSENARQDVQTANTIVDMKGLMKDNKDEIKADIRDLRNDLFKRGR